MSDRFIRLAIEGFASDDGHVRLLEFARQLKSLLSLLRSSEKLMSGAIESDYRVVELSHSSPATVVIEQVPIHAKNLPRPVIPVVIGAIDEISSGSVPDANRDLLKTLKAMTRPVGATVRSLIISDNNGSFANLTVQLGEQVTKMLGPEMTEFGEVKGRLEQINFHASANRFQVYPNLGPKRVACRFPSRLVSEAEQAVNKFVLVEGELRFKGADAFPYAVEVDRIHRLDDENTRVRLMDLQGKAPEALGDKSSEEFIWSIRDEW